MEASGLVSYGLGKQEPERGWGAWSIHLPGAGFQVGAQTADRLISEGLSRSMHGCGLGYMSVHFIKGRVNFPIFASFHSHLTQACLEFTLTPRIAHPLHPTTAAPQHPRWGSNPGLVTDIQWATRSPNTSTPTPTLAPSLRVLFSYSCDWQSK